MLLLTVVSLSLAICKAEPIGHMQPLGSHIEPTILHPIFKVPDPIRFFDDYVKPGKPLLMRGAAKKFPSYENLKSDSYLKRTYGDWMVDVEEGKKENRSFGLQSMRFAKFLDTYKSEEIYLVEDILPPNPLTDDVYLPKALLGGGITDYISTMIMWFSSGGTKSLLHNDGFDNFNCLYDGSKEIVLIDKIEIDSGIIDVPDEGYSKVDVDKVDLIKYPSISKIPWYKVTMEAGDCLYIPYQWYHQINSKGNRNLAINVWWNKILDLPYREQCKNDLYKLKEYQNTSNIAVANRTTTRRSTLFEVFQEGSDTATRKNFKYILIMYYDPVTQKETNRYIKELDLFFDKLDKNKNNLLEISEVFKAPRTAIIKGFLNMKRHIIDTNPYTKKIREKDEL